MNEEVGSQVFCSFFLLCCSDFDSLKKENVYDNNKLVRHAEILHPSKNQTDVLISRFDQLTSALQPYHILSYKLAAVCDMKF